MRILAGACLAVLALAACDRSTDKGNAPPADGTAPAGVARETPLPGVEAAPTVKGGLWEITSRTPGLEGKVRTCFDPGLQGESAIVAQGMDRRNCTRSDWKKTADGYSFEVACERGDRMFVSSGVLSGDLTSRYAIKADAVMTAAGQTLGAKQDITALHVGECPAGMRPGEALVFQDGQWRRPPTAG
jgi:hypothetical protein